MTNTEINEAVARIEGCYTETHLAAHCKPNDEPVFNTQWHLPDGSLIGSKPPDFCGDWALLMPLVVRFEIEAQYHWDGYRGWWECQKAPTGHVAISSHIQHDEDLARAYGLAIIAAHGGGE